MGIRRVQWQTNNPDYFRLYLQQACQAIYLELVGACTCAAELHLSDQLRDLVEAKCAILRVAKTLQDADAA